MNTLWRLIAGGLIGAIAGFISSKDVPLGIIGNIIAGLIGATIGETLIGSWGPQIAGMALIPSILGAVVLVFIASLFINSMNK